MLPVARVRQVTPDRVEIPGGLDQLEVVDLLEQPDSQDPPDHLEHPGILAKPEVLDLPVGYCAVDSSVIYRIYSNLLR